MSALDQKEVRQLDGMELDKRFTDKASGKDRNRPGSIHVTVPVEADPIDKYQPAASSHPSPPPPSWWRRRIVWVTASGFTARVRSVLLWSHFSRNPTHPRAG